MDPGKKGKLMVLEGDKEIAVSLSLKKQDGM
jgi:hypothetical protein